MVAVDDDTPAPAPYVGGSDRKMVEFDGAKLSREKSEAVQVRGHAPSKKPSGVHWLLFFRPSVHILSDWGRKIEVVS